MLFCSGRAEYTFTPRVRSRMDETAVESWEDFLAEVAMLRRTLNSPPVFRGQRNATWSLSTTLERIQSRMLFSEYYCVISRVKPQIESLAVRAIRQRVYEASRATRLLLEIYNPSYGAHQGVAPLGRARPDARHGKQVRLCRQ